MPAEPVSLAALACGFLLALARVGAVFAFVPFAGWRSATEPARIVFVLAITLALEPHWPKVAPAGMPLMNLVLRAIGETTIGLAVGVAVALLIEAFVMGAQLIAIQAGYSYASTVDPSSQADSNVLQALSQLFATLLLLSFDADRYLIRVMASTLALGAELTASESMWQQWHRLMDLGAHVWVAALRLSAPLLLLLLLVDLALSCMGRINTHLQLLSVAFPLKILATIAFLAILAGSIPPAFRQQAERFAAALPGAARP